jgi:hypothetical protein
LEFADILSFIINRFSGKITIDVSPERFLFSNGYDTLALDTYLYLSRNSAGDFLVLAIGERVGKDTCVRVDLFDQKSVLPDKVLRSSCLEAFLRFGFVKLSNRKAMLRPTVIFRGANSLNYITCGYHKKILSDAAKNAGAHSVEFSD